MLDIRNLLRTITVISLIMTMNYTSAQDTVKLPAPQKTGGLSLNEALSTRRSIREFDPTKQLPEQTIADLLWAATGINRPDGHRTNPTALNAQEIDVYLITKDGAYIYVPASHSLTCVAEGDHRSLVAGTPTFSQDFVMDAPVSLVIVADTGKFSQQPDVATLMGACDAGFASQNINLFCAANGLATVPRMTMDTNGLAKVLNLKPTQRPILNNPVGYAR